MQQEDNSNILKPQTSLAKTPRLKPEIKVPKDRVVPLLRKGRPSKLTYAMMERIQALLLAGNYDDVVCQVVGISRESFYSWLKRGQECDPDLNPEERIYADFFDVVEEARGLAEANVVATIQDAITGEDADARLALEWLRTKHPEKYGKQRLEISGPNGKPIEVDDRRGGITDNQRIDTVLEMLARAEAREKELNEPS